MMKAVVQRVSGASVTVDGREIGTIGRGLMVFAGLADKDTVRDIEYIVSKIAALRVFEDPEGRMNLSVAEVGGSLLVVSQFTLLGSTRRGNRPSFTGAMPVEQARLTWPEVERRFAATGLPCQFGIFQGDMKCCLINDGPVTLIIDSRDN